MLMKFDIHPERPCHYCGVFNYNKKWWNGGFNFISILNTLLSITLIEISLLLALDILLISVPMERSLFLQDGAIILLSLLILYSSVYQWKDPCSCRMKLLFCYRSWYFLHQCTNGKILVPAEWSYYFVIALDTLFISVPMEISLFLPDGAIILLSLLILSSSVYQWKDPCSCRMGLLFCYRSWYFIHQCTNGNILVPAEWSYYFVIALDTFFISVPMEISLFLQDGAIILLSLLILSSSVYQWKYPCSCRMGLLFCYRSWYFLHQCTNGNILVPAGWGYYFVIALDTLFISVPMERSLFLQDEAIILLSLLILYSSVYQWKDPCSCRMGLLFCYRSWYFLHQCTNGKILVPAGWGYYFVIALDTLFISVPMERSLFLQDGAIILLSLLILSSSVYQWKDPCSCRMGLLFCYRSWYFIHQCTNGKILVPAGWGYYFVIALDTFFISVPMERSLFLQDGDIILLSLLILYSSVYQWKYPCSCRMKLLFCYRSWYFIHQCTNGNILVPAEWSYYFVIALDTFFISVPMEISLFLQDGAIILLSLLILYSSVYQWKDPCSCRMGLLFCYRSWYFIHQCTDGNILVPAGWGYYLLSLLILYSSVYQWKYPCSCRMKLLFCYRSWYFIHQCTNGNILVPAEWSYYFVITLDTLFISVPMERSLFLQDGAIILLSLLILYSSVYQWKYPCSCRMGILFCYRSWYFLHQCTNGKILVPAGWGYYFVIALDTLFISVPMEISLFLQDGAIILLSLLILYSSVYQWKYPCSCRMGLLFCYRSWYFIHQCTNGKILVPAGWGYYFVIALDTLFISVPMERSLFLQDGAIILLSLLILYSSVYQWKYPCSCRMGILFCYRSWYFIHQCTNGNILVPAGWGYYFVIALDTLFISVPMERSLFLQDGAIILLSLLILYSSVYQWKYPCSCRMGILFCYHSWYFIHQCTNGNILVPAGWGYYFVIALDTLFISVPMERSLFLQDGAIILLSLLILYSSVYQWKYPCSCRMGILFCYRSWYFIHQCKYGKILVPAGWGYYFVIALDTLFISVPMEISLFLQDGDIILLSLLILYSSVYQWKYPCSCRMGILFCYRSWYFIHQCTNGNILVNAEWSYYFVIALDTLFISVPMEISLFLQNEAIILLSLLILYSSVYQWKDPCSCRMGLLFCYHSWYFIHQCTNGNILVPAGWGYYFVIALDTFFISVPMERSLFLQDGDIILLSLLILYSSVYQWKYPCSCRMGLLFCYRSWYFIHQCTNGNILVPAGWGYYFVIALDTLFISVPMERSLFLQDGAIILLSLLILYSSVYQWKYPCSCRMGILFCYHSWYFIHQCTNGNILVPAGWGYYFVIALDTFFISVPMERSLFLPDGAIILLSLLILYSSVYQLKYPCSCRMKLLFCYRSWYFIHQCTNGNILVPTGWGYYFVITLDTLFISVPMERSLFLQDGAIILLSLLILSSSVYQWKDPCSCRMGLLFCYRSWYFIHQCTNGKIVVPAGWGYYFVIALDTLFISVPMERSLFLQDGAIILLSLLILYSSVYRWKDPCSCRMGLLFCYRSWYFIHQCTNGKILVPAEWSYYFVIALDTLFISVPMEISLFLQNEAIILLSLLILSSSVYQWKYPCSCRMGLLFCYRSWYFIHQCTNGKILVPAGWGYYFVIALDTLFISVPMERSLFLQDGAIILLSLLILYSSVYQWKYPCSCRMKLLFYYRSWYFIHQCTNGNILVPAEWSYYFVITLDTLFISVPMERSLFLQDGAIILLSLLILYSSVYQWKYLCSCRMGLLFCYRSWYFLHQCTDGKILVPAGWGYYFVIALDTLFISVPMERSLFLQDGAIILLSLLILSSSVYQWKDPCSCRMGLLFCYRSWYFIHQCTNGKILVPAGWGYYFVIALDTLFISVPMERSLFLQDGDIILLSLLILCSSVYQWKYPCSCRMGLLFCYRSWYFIHQCTNGKILVPAGWGYYFVIALDTLFISVPMEISLFLQDGDIILLSLLILYSSVYQWKYPCSCRMGLLFCYRSWYFIHQCTNGKILVPAGWGYYFVIALDTLFISVPMEISLFLQDGAIILLSLLILSSSVYQWKDPCSCRMKLLFCHHSIFNSSLRQWKYPCSWRMKLLFCYQAYQIMIALVMNHASWWYCDPPCCWISNALT